MRILTLTCEYPPVGGGGATVCQVLAQALVRAGHEVDVLTAKMADLAREEWVGGVRVVRAGGWRRQRHHSTAFEQASFMLPMLLRGRTLVAKRAYDLVHAHFVIPTGLIARHLARSHGLPYVVTAHGSDVPGYNPDRFALIHRLIGPAWHSVLDEAAAVTSPSTFVRGLIRTRANIAVDVIPNAYDAVGPVAVPKRRRVLTVTRLVERKGIRHLISALAGLERDVECIIAGDGPQRAELERQAQASALPIRFTGFLDRHALQSLYASADIFVLPSSQENFPMVLLEAMAAGCAVVTTTHPGCAEVVGEAALKVPADDVGALREALATLLDNPELNRALASAGRERASRFASGAVASRFAGLFERCAKRPAEHVQVVQVPVPQRD